MKRNMIVLVLLLTVLMFGSSFAFAEDSPMHGWRFENGSCFLNGHWFDSERFADSYREQDGYALVLGRKLHYWLYDTYSYHDGNGRVIVAEAVPRWVEKMGYVIDFDNIKIYNPNTNLANSVKVLMRQRGCDVSVALCTRENGLSTDTDYVVINGYDKDTNIYETIIYYLYK